MRTPDGSEAAAASTDAAHAEIQQLKARVAALEEELVEQAARANRAIAAAQDRAYWLDRWHVDLNAIMRRRGVEELRAVVRVLRSVWRWLKRPSSAG